VDNLSWEARIFSRGVQYTSGFRGSKAVDIILKGSVRGFEGKHPSAAVSHFMTLAAENPPLSTQDNAQLGGHRRIPTLDGLRGLAILMVMLFHMTLLTSTTLLDRVWINIAGYGWVGVDLFFVLSGFLITGLLLDAKGGAAYFRNFYARRILRIFPLYYFVVVLSLVILPHIHNAKSEKFGAIKGDEWWYWVYLSNYIIGYRHAFRHGILDVSWTLAIEEQFYLLWPAVVFLFDRKTILKLCAALIAVAIITRSTMNFYGLSPITILTFTPCRMDALLMGAVVALLIRAPGGIDRLFRWARFLALALGIIMLVYLIWQGPSWDDGRFGQCLGYTCNAILFASCLLLSLRLKSHKLPSRFLNHPILIQLGRYSYALYLFHFPIRAVIRDTLYGPTKFATFLGSQMPGQILFYAIAMSISFCAAWISWHAFEMHFLKLKRLFPMPEKPLHQAPVTPSVAAK
jgi:peptidoglycan/LPS O-acetylase OafA/YrhL